MKIQVTMKTPDALEYGIRNAVMRQPDAVAAGVEPDDPLVEFRTEELIKQCSKWFRFRESITVEIDTEAGTCTVLPLTPIKWMGMSSDVGRTE